MRDIISGPAVLAKTVGPRRVCQACQRADQEFCDHCFRRGLSGHFVRGCRRGAASVPNREPGSS